MSGHSKWAQIKHKKAKVDKERGKIFNKLIREITVAARLAGGNPEFNPRLRLAIDQAKEHNMPLDNIERAIKRGTGELEGVHYEDVVYEGYGPGGVAIIVEVTTDNRNRTTAEIRHIFTKYNGNLGATGCVAWQFNQKGVIHITMDVISEDELFELAADAGAEDFKSIGDTYEIVTAVDDFEMVKEKVSKKNIPMDATLTKIPTNTVKVEGKKAEQVLKLLQALEEHDDVQRSYSNFDIEDSELEALAKAL